jgi:chromodomain-helicase-DNA-binding protein 1
VIIWDYVQGLKKVENYVKKQQELLYWKRRSNPEDVEYMECQLEMQENLLASYTTVERIVDRQFPEADAEYPDYYVKWKNLPYSEATWENGKVGTSALTILYLAEADGRDELPKVVTSEVGRI